MARVPYSIFYVTPGGILDGALIPDGDGRTYIAGQPLSMGTVVDDSDPEFLARGITRLEIPAGDMKPKGKGKREDRVWNERTFSFDAITLPRTLNVTVFWERFTDAEQEEIIFRSVNGTTGEKRRLGRFLEGLRISKRIDLNDQRVIDTVNGIEDAGVIGAGRAAEVLA